jgi:ketosteroid isomerase-like protein
MADEGGWSALYRKVGDAWKVEWLIATSERPERGRTADGADERALLQIEKDWAAALLKADTKALETVLAPGWATSFEGAVMTRPQLFAALRTGAARFDVLEASEEEAFVLGDSALVSGLVRIKGVEGGKPFDGKSRYTDLFVRRDGRWHAVVGYNTPVE